MSRIVIKIWIDHLDVCVLGTGGQKVQFHAIDHDQGVQNHEDFLEEKYQQGGNVYEGTLDCQNHAVYSLQGCQGLVGPYEDLQDQLSSLEQMNLKTILSHYRAIEKL